jgi:uncharacterized protein (TIGR02147 family)
MEEQALQHAPDIFGYLDYRRYLEAWFAWRKKDNPRFSHRAFMRRAGVTSPSLLLSVIERQRNLTPGTAEAFTKAMRLSEEEAEFFQNLVELDQADGLEERNRAWEKVRATRRFREARVLEGASVEYLSCWYYPAIRELAACKGFKADPAYIAQTLRPQITEAQAAIALERLQTLGMLKEQDGQLIPAEASIVTPHEVAGMAAMNYHIGMIGRAGEAIQTTPATQRHYCAVTVAIPEARLAQLKQELDRFQERILDLCDSVEEPRQRVFQINLQIFPLSCSTQS